MISADIIELGNDEPTWNIAFEQAPAIGDRIYISDGLAPVHETFDVTRREWYADPNRKEPNYSVTLWVRPATAEEEQARG